MIHPLNSALDSAFGNNRSNRSQRTSLPTRIGKLGLLLLLLLASPVLGGDWQGNGAPENREQTETESDWVTASQEKDAGRSSTDQNKTEPTSKPATSATGDGSTVAQDPAAKLPWERRPQHQVPQLTEPSERELLVDVSPEEILSIQEGRSIASQQQLFAKLLYRVSRFGVNQFFRLANRNREISLTELKLEPGFHRCKVIAVRGIAREWEARKLPPEIGNLFDLSIYYKVKIVADNGQSVLAYALDIPNPWKGNSQLREDVHLQGLFVNVMPGNGPTEVLNFVTDRIQWTPTSESPLITRTGPALLGSAGFDLGLLDALPQLNKRRLEAEDKEAFYQMLQAARLIANSKDTPDWRSEVPEFDLIDHLKKPATHHGDLSVISVEIRNVTRVRTENPAVRDRIGVEEYFQLDGFVRFDSSVTYKGDDDKEGAVFKDKYPVCVCINQLPSNWEIGANQHYLATFPVFFYKIWAYPSGYQAQFSEKSMQQSPLLIALKPIESESASPSINWTTLLLVGAIGIGVISMWTTYFISKVKRGRPASSFQLPSKLEISSEQAEQAEPEKGPVPGMPVIRDSDPTDTKS